MVTGDDGDVGAAALLDEPENELVAVDVGHDHVDDDGVGRLAAVRGLEVAAVDRHLDGEAQTGGDALDERGEPRLVVYDQ